VRSRLSVGVIGVAFALVIGIVLASSGSSGRAFETDERVRIVSPRSLEVVEPPFTLKWSGGVPEASSYAVFIDRPPMPPNSSLREYSEQQCENTTLCPGSGAKALEAWLEQRGIFTTKSSKLEIPFISTRGPSTEKDTRDTHEAILVALGKDGRRIGESAWNLRFRVPPQEFGS
jgi:hypothetical protein